MKDYTPYINDELIASIANSFSRNVPIRIKLADGGRIHIDRQLPFLAVYRRPSWKEDLGTDRMLLGEAAYMLVDDKPGHHEPLAKLIKEILSLQQKQFGSGLLLELWSGTEVSDETREPAFRIYAPNHNTPPAFLEGMEKALLNIRVNHQSKVTITYQDRITPPEQSPLITELDIKHFNCVHIGLEVSPVYRDAGKKTLLPFRLRQLHHCLAHALKRTFFEFTHCCTPLRPAHFLELGRRAITHAVHETDEKLSDISNRFDLLLHVTPVNTPAAWQEFQASHYKKTPDFLYRPRNIDPDLMKRELYNIPIERIEDPTLAYIFSQKREELDRQITLITDRNTPRFLLGSRQLFGDVNEELLQLAKQLLAIKSPSEPNNNVYLNATEFAKRAREEIEYYKQQDRDLPAQVQLREDIPGIMVSKGNFLVGADAMVSADRIDATLTHEIGTHVLTHYNGSQQPFRELYAGMAGYEPMQEGLAVLGEYLVGGLSQSRLQLLAGRVIAVHMITDSADFIETFSELHQHHDFAPYTAFIITMRVFRGGGYTKDMVYLQGLVNIVNYLSQNGDLDRLYLGKISYEHINFIEELQWRKVLTAPKLRPRFLDNLQANARLKSLRQGKTVLNLMQETK